MAFQAEEAFSDWGRLSEHWRGGFPPVRGDVTSKKGWPSEAIPALPKDAGGDCQLGRRVRRASRAQLQPSHV